MKLLFQNAEVYGYGQAHYLATDAERITYIGTDRPAGDFDRVIDCKGKIILSGLYNCHTHAAMTLFRGYGEDMPLQSWLNDCIFPAEDRLTNHSVYVASKWAAAEMLQNGIVSASDMYFFCDQTVKAFGEIGLKANISRSVVSFDDTPILQNNRYLEGEALFREYHNSYDGRIKIDFALHAEYTNTPYTVGAVAQKAKELGAQMHIHLSETQGEHQECIARHGKTPTAFFADLGVFDTPTSAAHSVWCDENDMRILAQKGVSVIHNPCSNLKLGSGVMPLQKMLSAGVNVALGTDGTASNNTLDILSEMYTCAITQKGVFYDTEFPRAQTVIDMATRAGAKAQGRTDCGELKVGCRADLTVIDADSVNMIPSYRTDYAVLYAAKSKNVTMTVVDGNILYENGEWKTLDIEALKYEMKEVCANYFKD
jgi:5-methylthioadenosine/S-adenosylhomocysteine deaminase